MKFKEKDYTFARAIINPFSFYISTEDFTVGSIMRMFMQELKLHTPDQNLATVKLSSQGEVDAECMK